MTFTKFFILFIFMTMKINKTTSKLPNNEENYNYIKTTTKTSGQQHPDSGLEEAKSSLEVYKKTIESNTRKKFSLLPEEPKHSILTNYSSVNKINNATNTITRNPNFVPYKKQELFGKTSSAVDNGESQEGENSINRDVDQIEGIENDDPKMTQFIRYKKSNDGNKIIKIENIGLQKVSNELNLDRINSTQQLNEDESKKIVQIFNSMNISEGRASEMNAQRLGRERFLTQFPSLVSCLPGSRPGPGGWCRTPFQMKKTPKTLSNLSIKYENKVEPEMFRGNMINFPVRRIPGFSAPVQSRKASRIHKRQVNTFSRDINRHAFENNDIQTFSENIKLLQQLRQASEGNVGATVDDHGEINFNIENNDDDGIFLPQQIRNVAESAETGSENRYLLTPINNPRGTNRNFPLLNSNNFHNLLLNNLTNINSQQGENNLLDKFLFAPQSSSEQLTNRQPIGVPLPAVSTPQSDNILRFLSSFGTPLPTQENSNKLSPLIVRLASSRAPTSVQLNSNNQALGVPLPVLPAIPQVQSTSSDTFERFPSRTTTIGITLPTPTVMIPGRNIHNQFENSAILSQHFGNEQTRSVGVPLHASTFTLSGKDSRSQFLNGIQQFGANFPTPSAGENLKTANEPRGILLPIHSSNVQLSNKPSLVQNSESLQTTIAFDEPKLGFFTRNEKRGFNEITKPVNLNSKHGSNLNLVRSLQLRPDEVNKLFNDPRSSEEDLKKSSQVIIDLPSDNFNRIHTPHHTNGEKYRSGIFDSSKNQLHLFRLNDPTFPNLITHADVEHFLRRHPIHRHHTDSDVELSQVSTQNQLLLSQAYGPPRGNQRPQLNNLSHESQQTTRPSNPRNIQLSLNSESRNNARPQSSYSWVHSKENDIRFNSASDNINSDFSISRYSDGPFTGNKRREGRKENQINYISSTVPSASVRTNQFSWDHAESLSGTAPSLSGRTNLFSRDQVESLSGTAPTLSGRTNLFSRDHAELLSGTVPSLSGRTNQLSWDQEESYSGSAQGLSGRTNLFSREQAESLSGSPPSLSGRTNLFSRDHAELLSGTVPSLSGRTNLFSRDQAELLSGTVPSFSLSGRTNQLSFDQDESRSGSAQGLSGRTNLFSRDQAESLSGTAPSVSGRTNLFSRDHAELLSGTVPSLSGRTNLFSRDQAELLSGTVPSLSGRTNLFNRDQAESFSGTAPSLPGRTNLFSTDQAGSLSGTVPSLSGRTNLFSRDQAGSLSGTASSLSGRTNHISSGKQINSLWEWANEK